MINIYGFLGNTYQSTADSSLYRLKPDHFAMNPINVGVGDFLKRVWVGVYGAFIDAFWFCDRVLKVFFEVSWVWQQDELWTP